MQPSNSQRLYILEKAVEVLYRTLADVSRVLTANTLTLDIIRDKVIPSKEEFDELVKKKLKEVQSQDKSKDETPKEV